MILLTTTNLKAEEVEPVDNSLGARFYVGVPTAGVLLHKKGNPIGTPGKGYFNIGLALQIPLNDKKEDLGGVTMMSGKVVSGCGTNPCDTTIKGADATISPIVLKLGYYSTYNDGLLLGFNLLITNGFGAGLSMVTKDNLMFDFGFTMRTATGDSYYKYVSNYGPSGQYYEYENKETKNEAKALGIMFSIAKLF
ncbi:MAG: hypothetical protein Ta2D_12260 [Rickettsiales bacterium]|nr:MAG: hypothetical protein Ta2D_12260 [Rickettsiales bacterium]